MALATHSPETDLLIPLPDEGERWDHHTIHTHYFGFCVPEAALGAFIYIRYQPTFPLCQGGVHIFRGTANLAALDGAFLDYEMTMPYPDGVDGVFTTTNGLRISFPEPGRVAHISYCSRDESTHFQLVQTAVTPLLARGHVVPGEEDHHNDPGAKPGGTEQIMHVTGQLTIRGEVFAVDCYAPRDRSWRQVRVENQGGGQPVPPVCWSPMYFGDDLAFNQVSFEAPDTDPAWAGMYTLPPDRPLHYSSWVASNGEVLEVVRVHRKVVERHPIAHVATRQEIEAEDEAGRTYRFEGTAIAIAPVPAWPNFAFWDTVYRWEDEQGRLSHGSCQEGWTDIFQREMTARSARLRTG